MKTKLKIKVRTLAARHYKQLPYTHNWEGTYPWKDKVILGADVTDGFILTQDKKTGELQRVAPIAFLDWKANKLGGYKGAMSMAEAMEARDAIPQIFAD